jgi:dihydrofolate reductase
MMRTLIVNEWMTLDGVVQAPMEVEEDTSGGFRHGGWHVPYADEAFMAWVVKGLNDTDAFLLGRRTYEGFAAHWPNASEEEQPVARPLNERTKFVASTTLDEPLQWQNSILLHGDVANAVRQVKDGGTGNLRVIGSTQLVQTLIANDLVDEYQLIIDPVTVGGGKRIFPDDGALRALDVVGSEVTSTGAMIVTYAAKRG